MALIAGRIFTGRRMPLRFWIAACSVSVLPDADAILHWAGVPYEHMFGHRGFFHSLAFAALVAALLTPLLFKERRRAVGLLLFVVGASHGVLDAMTAGGLGTAFLAPFDDTRTFFAWRPLPASPIGVLPFFSIHGLRALRNEFVYVWLPLLLLLHLATRLRARAEERRTRYPA